MFEHPVVSLPTQPGCQRQDRLGDMAADASRAPTINSTSVSRPTSGLDCTISPTDLQMVVGKLVS